MLRDVEKTVGNLADKAGLFFVGSIDADGNPNIKGMFAAKEKRRHQEVLPNYQHVIA